MRRAWPFVLALLGGCAALRSFWAEHRPHGVPATALRVPGAEARAAGVAFDDFAAQLASRRAEPAESTEANPDGGGVSSTRAEPTASERECASNPGTYDTWIYPGDAGTSLVVEFWPRWQVCYGEGAVVFGGGAHYEIDARSFSILNKEMWE